MRFDLTPHPTIRSLFLTRDGRVFRELPLSPSDNGYRTVKVGGQTIRHHTLVAETFVGQRPPGQGVRHLDGNPANDDPSNLAWGTQGENMADTVAHGRSTRGARNRHNKLTEDQAREIKRRRVAGESGRSLATEFNISEQVVCDIYKGRHWGWLS
jgi:hypothetical protein